MYLKVKKEIIASTVFEDKWYKVVKEKEYFYIVKKNETREVTVPKFVVDKIVDEETIIEQLEIKDSQIAAKDKLIQEQYLEIQQLKENNKYMPSGIIGNAIQENREFKMFIDSPEELKKFIKEVEKIKDERDEAISDLYRNKEEIRKYKNILKEIEKLISKWCKKLYNRYIKVITINSNQNFKIKLNWKDPKIPIKRDV